MAELPDETLLDDLDLSIRTSSVLKYLGCKTAGDVRAKHDGELLRVPNFGRKSLKEIRDALRGEQDIDALIRRLHELAQEANNIAADLKNIRSFIP
jgi:DNA-directed RNA polymerase alpha subunit